ncbi:MAG: hypothetical protein GXY05_03475 [Clostridiales bacterium]|nr:hypothetical protein [Clostridiales bacterium]
MSYTLIGNTFSSDETGLKFALSFLEKNNKPSVIKLDYSAGKCDISADLAMPHTKGEVNNIIIELIESNRELETALDAALKKAILLARQ